MAFQLGSKKKKQVEEKSVESPELIETADAVVDMFDVADIVAKEEDSDWPLKDGQDDSVFSIDKANLEDDAVSVPALIEVYSTRASEAKREWHLVKAARNARFDDAKYEMRKRFDGLDKKHRTTDKQVEIAAGKDKEYRKLVKATIDAESRYDIENGRLSAAFMKGSMLKGLLFMAGRESIVDEDTNLGGITDVSVSLDDFSGSNNDE